MTSYKIYDPATYITRELWRQVVETNDLRIVWAHLQAQKWQVDYTQYLAKCPTQCPCCGKELNYGVGRNHPDERKHPENTPSTDHIIPKSVAPELEYGVIENLQVMCLRCNTIKNNATIEDAPIYRYIGNMLEHSAEQYTVLMEIAKQRNGAIEPKNTGAKRRRS